MCAFNREILFVITGEEEGASAVYVMLHEYYRRQHLIRVACVTSCVCVMALCVSGICAHLCH